MNEAAKTQQTSEFFWKRLTEPFPLPLFKNEDYNSSLWWVLLGSVLTLALVYVIIMYIRDSRRVGLWGLLLGGLRLSVYAILAILFLLPARRHITQAVDQSKVLVLFDVSLSMEDTRDGVPQQGQKVSDLPTRQDQVLAFLTDKKVVFDDKEEVKVDFFEGLEKRNPVTAYRFHSELDKSSFHFSDGRVWTNTEWVEYQRNPGTSRVPVRERLDTELWETWLKPKKHALRVNQQDQRDELNKTALGALRVANGDLLQPGQELIYGTDVAGALDALFEEEANHRLQGVVIFTDGRSTRRSIDKFDRVKDRAARLRVPIFVVGVGAFHQKVQITPNPLGVPERIQPDAPFQVVVQAVGEGLAGEKVDVTLEVHHVRKLKDNTFEELDIFLEEDKGPKLGGRLDDKQPGDKPIEDKPKEPKPDDKPDDKSKSDLPKRVSLGKLLKFKPKDAATDLPRIPEFSKESPPQLVVPFDLTPKDFVEAADAKAKKELGTLRWVLAPTEPDTELQFRAIIGKHAREVTEDTEHVTRVQGMKVIKKPLRVLLFAGGSSQEYRFVQRVMAQEMEKGLVEVAFYVQQSTLKREDQIVAHKQDPFRRRTLIAFPTKYKKQGPDLPKKDVEENDGFGIDVERIEASGKKTEADEIKLYDLDNYDVILAFDADWGKLDEQQVRNVVDWVEGKKDREKGGGGLVVIAGPVNTTRLARNTINPDLVKLLPVVPKDIVLETSRVEPKEAWRLDFLGATPDLEFLRLAEGDDPGAKGNFLDDWKEVFGPPPDTVPNASPNLATRGIHSVYPVQEVRGPTVLVPARFTDDRVKAMADGKKQPFLAMWPSSDEKRVIWIGSGELWRLRTFSGPTGDGVGVKFYERFWAKLIRYAGAKRMGASGKKLNVMHYGDYKVNGKVTVVADYTNPDGTPLPPDSKMRLRVTFPQDALNAASGAQPGKANERTLTMEPMPRAGRFRLPFALPLAGTYKLEAEIGDTRSESSEFTVDAYNPEIENTQPDFDDMWYLASHTDLVTARINDENVKRKVLEKLQRPRLEGTIKVDSKGETITDDGKARLYFTLANAHLIPLCMISDPNTTTTQGSVEDLWDAGWEFNQSSNGRPLKFSYALMVASLLLSMEWLFRKLLRLA